jgi:5'-nucleotidase
MPLVDSSNGSAAVAFMNSCGYDLMTVGNHEFDWGAEALDANIADSSFPWLSANVIDNASGGPRFATNKIIELSDGTKVGFFGLTTPSTLTTTRPSNIVGLTFLQNNDLYHCAQAQVDELRDKGCELVVCVGHLGNDSIAQKDGSKDVLEAVSGIDLFIDGHDHDEVDEEVNGTPLVETGCYLHNIGVVAIDAGAPTPELLAAGSYDGIDGATQAIIDSENARVEEELSVVVASTPFLLDAERAHVRMQETNLGDLVTDALRWSAEQELAVKPDAAIVNGGAIRQSIPEGDISLKTIKTVMPFSNVFVLLELTGAQLLEALEASCQGIGQDKELGAFPQVSGIRFAIDASVPFEEGPTYPGSTFASPARPGARITIEDVGGRVFSEEDVYQVATSDYLCQGGDTYRVFKDAADAKQPTPFGIDYEVISSFLIVACDHEVPADYAQPQDRITIVGL